MNRRIKILRTGMIIVLLVAVKASDVLSAPSAPGEFHLRADSPLFWNLVWITTRS
jgi:hypothetical protein